MNEVRESRENKSGKSENADLLAQWDEQIGARDGGVIRHLARWAGVTVAPCLNHLAWRAGECMAPLGTFIYFSLCRPRPQGGKSGGLMLSAFRSRRQDGRIVIGGDDGRRFAHNLCLRPMRGGTGIGVDVRKTTTLTAGLVLDQAITSVALSGREGLNEPGLPVFWAGFPKGQLPEPEDTPELQHDLLQRARAGAWPTTARIDGFITAAAAGDGGGAAVELDSGEQYLFPPGTVLKPEIVEGGFIEAGTPLCDPVPARDYRSYRELTAAVSPEVLAWMRRVTAASDKTWGGLSLVRTEYVPSHLDDAACLLEDAEPMLVEDKTSGKMYYAPQVCPDGGLMGDYNSMAFDLSPGQPVSSRQRR
jgi:hypothetical protein